MKKFIISTLVLWSLVMPCVAQQSYVPQPASYDYSSYKSNCKSFITSLENVQCTDNWTYVHLKLAVLKDDAVKFPSSIYIEGNGFREQVRVLFDPNTNKVLELDKFYYIYKKQQLDVVLAFRPIPVGIDRISYIEPNFIRFSNIQIENPDTSIHTDWDEDSLISWWSKNEMSYIEGIYEFLDCDNTEWWGPNKFTVAVKKDGRNYQVIYLDGYRSNNFWKEGDVKAVMRSSAVPNLFKANWYLDTKRISDNIYITFDQAMMIIKEKEHNVEARFLKMYPTASQHNPAGSEYPVDSSNAPEFRNSGSGIIISTNGVVITNYHVIEEAKNIDVVVKDNRKVSTYRARVLASDKTNDLALLMIDDEKFLHFDYIPFAMSTRTSEVGTSVFAMGYPMSLYMGDEVKITDGIISSRTGYQGDIVTYQISAPIQPGNSGGPLFDKNGYLVGITNAGIMNANNVGYAIKSSYVRNLIESAPISIDIPEVNKLQDLELTEQIKQLSKFVTYIKVK